MFNNLAGLVLIATS